MSSLRIGSQPSKGSPQGYPGSVVAAMSGRRCRDAPEQCHGCAEGCRAGRGRSTRGVRLATCTEGPPGLLTELSESQRIPKLVESWSTQVGTSGFAAGAADQPKRSCCPGSQCPSHPAQAWRPEAASCVERHDTSDYSGRRCHVPRGPPIPGGRLARGSNLVKRVTAEQLHGGRVRPTCAAPWR
jgi:hypothetical protein